MSISSQKREMPGIRKYSSFGSLLLFLWFSGQWGLMKARPILVPLPLADVDPVDTRGSPTTGRYVKREEHNEERESKHILLFFTFLLVFDLFYIYIVHIHLAQSMRRRKRFRTLVRRARQGSKSRKSSRML
jgi:hypothetical protein